MDRESEALLDTLDRVREARGSVALFDAVAAGDVAAAVAGLAVNPRHPAAEAVRSWMRARGVEPPAVESATDALVRHGITDVEAWVQASAGREATLTRALEEARAARDLALRSANTYAGVAALLAVLAIVGWLGLLGIPLPSLPQPDPAPTEEPAAEAK